MKKLFATLALLCAMTTGAEAQVIEVYNGSSTTPVASYKNDDANTYKVQFKTSEGNAPSIVVYKGETAEATFTNDASNSYKAVFKEDCTFTVNAAGKKVHFTKGNLYWNGSAFQLEESQIARPTTWSTTHVSHFFWSTYNDFSSSYSNDKPYLASYDQNNLFNAATDFWCGEAHKLTVGNLSLYALTKDEWDYLLTGRTNASSLYKCGVQVTIGDTTAYNCLVLAPDLCLNNYTFDNTKTTYTAAEWATAEAAGLVCLPLTEDRRDGTTINSTTDPDGYYWTATVSPIDDTDKTWYPKGAAYYLNFDKDGYIITMNGVEYGYALRLVY